MALRVHTLPSDALVTKPVTPRLRAVFWVKDLKLTPCTRPSTLYWICAKSLASATTAATWHDSNGRDALAWLTLCVNACAWMGGGGEGHGSAPSTVQRVCCYGQGEEYSYATRQDTRGPVKPLMGQAQCSKATSSQLAKLRRYCYCYYCYCYCCCCCCYQSDVGGGTPATSRMVDGCGARGRAPLLGRWMQTQAETELGG